jgi:hypothetical protein
MEKRKATERRFTPHSSIPFFQHSGLGFQHSNPPALYSIIPRTGFDGVR